MKKYYNEVNVARAIAITLVILGHSFPDAETHIFNNNIAYKYLFYIIYSFHMPLFIFLSGFVSYKIFTIYALNDKLFYIKKKFFRLLLPYLVLSIPGLILKYFFQDLAYHKFDFNNAIFNVLCGNSAMGGIYFLYTLFIISVFALIINKFPIEMTLVIFTAIKLFIPNVPHVFALNYIQDLAVYYFIGLYTNKNYDKIKNILKSNMFAIAAPLCFILIEIIHLHSGQNSIFYNLFIAILGIYATLSLSTKLESKIASEIGKYSYDIFIVSWFIQVPIRVIMFTKLHLQYNLIVICMFIFGLVMPYLISKYVLRKIKVINNFVLGNYKPKATILNKTIIQ